jgi:hypothetical protein
MTTDPQLTGAFADAVREAERLIAAPPFEVSERQLADGYNYLAGSIRSAIQAAFDYDLAHPILITATHQYSRQGLDNPDAIYFNAYLDEGGEYLVTGRRGSTTDLAFQVMDGNYSAEGSPTSLASFDDRELDIAEDGTFEWRFSADELGFGRGASLIIREVFHDWDTEERGTIRIQRLDTAGVPRGPFTLEAEAKRFGVAAKMLIGRIHTWFAFPTWFTYPLPVNTLSVPTSTPGGLASQFSSLGHYDLAPVDGEEQALVITVPACEAAPYQAIQIGSPWYVSTDYEHHQTAMTRAQSQVDPDGMIRYVVSESNPGVTNWLEACGNPRGVIMLRWQRVTRPLGEQDAPSVQVVPLAEVGKYLPYDQSITPEQWTARIESRQVGVAKRMLS